MTEGQTHYYGDGCDPPHSPTMTEEDLEVLEQLAEQSAYERAVDATNDALAATKERLAQLRHARDLINDEVRNLVAEEYLLHKMARASARKAFDVPAE